MELLSVQAIHRECEMVEKPHKGCANTETVTRLKPKRHDVIVEALQLVIDYGDHYDLSQPTRDEIAGAVGKLAPPEKWGFVMLNPDQQRAVLKAIDATPKPLTIFKVWNACISFIAYDRDGEIMAARPRLAEAANVALPDVSMAMKKLVEIGAVVRLRPGRYRVNPFVAWSGPLHKRELAAKDQRPVRPQLTVVEGGLSEAAIQAEQQRSQELKARAIAFLRVLDAETLAAWAARATQVGIPGMPPTTAENVEEWAFFVEEELQEQGLIP
jgi:hypothetical protein